MIGKPTSDIDKIKLPLNKDVLRYFYHVKSVKPDLQEKDIICRAVTKNYELQFDQSCVCVIKQIKDIRAGFPTLSVKSMKNKVLFLIKRHKRRLTLQSRETDIEKKEKNFKKQFCISYWKFFQLILKHIIKKPKG